MKFAKLTFRVAGIWGFLVIIPMYFLYNLIGKQDPPALSHPHFYFGWLGVTLAWQVAFLIIGSDPVRYRPIMIAAMLEKFGFAAAVAVLLVLKAINVQEAVMAVPDAILLVLFLLAYRKTGPALRS
jgi:hypothetical protein